MNSAAKNSRQDTHLVIFGGSSGIGLATAAAAKACGASVTIVGHRFATLESVANKIGRARIVVADICDRNRVGTPDEVAQAILFLLTNNYMNAEVLHIDGGGRYA